jgi:alpha-glucosidase
VYADWQSLPAVTKTTRLRDGVELSVGKATVRVTALSTNTIRVRVAETGSFPADESWAVVSPPPAQAQIVETSQSVTISVAAGQVRISKKPFRVSFYDSAGTLVSEEASTMAFDGTHFRVRRAMPENEMYFGLGDKTSLNLRDHAYTLWNTDVFGWQESTDPLYKTIPFFIAMRAGNAYGIFMDNTWRSSFDFGKERHDSYSFGAEGGELNYYFFFGPDPKTVLGSFMELTGKPPLPPLWTLGYQQCRYSYYPEARVREIAKTFRDKQIPADVIYLDIDYQDGYRPFTINRNYFPQFEGMVKDLRQDGFSVIAITDLHIAAADYPPYTQGKAQDVFIKNPDGTDYVGKVWPGPSVFPEFTLSRTRDWWGGLYKDFVDIGIRGFWNDMNEPSVFVESKTMPLDTRHRLDNGKTLPHLAIHNVLGMQNGRATFEGLLKLQKNERPFVLTRATYAGGQRFTATWTGDNTSSWNHLRMSVPTLLNMGISGQPLVGVDIGGFNGSPTGDLLTRWMFLGAFNPIFRNHTAKGTKDQEPWVFGPEYEKQMKRAIEQRYRMLPYIYTAAEEASRTGTPIMRPLFLEFPQEQWLNANETEFMFGRAMLVAPKVWDMVDLYEVQLPTGEWYDYWSGTKVQGGHHDSGPSMDPTIERLKIKVDPKIDELPVYVRAGSIIPHQPVVQSTAFTPQGPLELRVYPGPNCSGALYMDDGHTFDYKKDSQLRISMTCTADSSSASLNIDQSRGQYKPWFSELRIVFYGAPSAPKSVLSGKNELKGVYDGEQHTVSVTVPYTGAAEKIQLDF